ncbi:MAG TPA: hypothetical protein PKW95_19300 [bacterium]|nr:hypothetical protein [bacterium]
MRHFDLDDIHAFGPLTERLKDTAATTIRDVVGANAKIDLEDNTLETLYHGRQTILRRRLLWTAAHNESALKVEILLNRFLNPNEASVNNTLRLTVKPVSRLALIARVLLVSLLPLAGLVGGLLLWRFLQFDTGMTVAPWAITGAILGAVVAVAALPFWTNRLGALLEGRQAINAPACRQRLGNELAGQIEALTSVQPAAPTDEIREDLPAKPADLAKYTHDLLTDPDTAIAAYGLYDQARRTAIATAFTQCYSDAAEYKTYQQTLSDLNGPK